MRLIHGWVWYSLHARPDTELRSIMPASPVQPTQLDHPRVHCESAAPTLTDFSLPVLRWIQDLGKGARPETEGVFTFQLFLTSTATFMTLTAGLFSRWHCVKSEVDINVTQRENPLSGVSLKTALKNESCQKGGPFPLIHAYLSSLSSSPTFSAPSASFDLSFDECFSVQVQFEKLSLVLTRSSICASLRLEFLCLHSVRDVQQMPTYSCVVVFIFLRKSCDPARTIIRMACLKTDTLLPNGPRNPTQSGFHIR